MVEIEADLFFKAIIFIAVMVGLVVGYFVGKKNA